MRKKDLESELGKLKIVIRDLEKRVRQLESTLPVEEVVCPHLGYKRKVINDDFLTLEDYNPDYYTMPPPLTDTAPLAEGANPNKGKSGESSSRDTRTGS